MLQLQEEWWELFWVGEAGAKVLQQCATAGHITVRRRVGT